MTVAFPLPSPGSSVRPSGPSSHLGYENAVRGDFPSATPAEGGSVDGALKSVPYQGWSAAAIDFPPIDYAVAEKSLRDYCAAVGEDFGILVKEAGARAPGEFKPWGGELGDAEIDDMMLGDDEAVGGDMS